MIEFVLARFRQRVLRHVEPETSQRLRRVTVRHPVKGCDHHAAADGFDPDFEPAAVRFVRYRPVGGDVFRYVGKRLDPHRPPDAVRPGDCADANPVAIRRALNPCRRCNRRGTSAAPAAGRTSCRQCQPSFFSSSSPPSSAASSAAASSAGASSAGASSAGASLNCILARR